MTVIGGRQALLFEVWCKHGTRDVVGEMSYLDNIKSLFARQISTQGSELDLTAILVPEPSNPHDRNAVAVVIRGVLVGYLSREEASRYAPVLTALQQRGVVAAVEAHVWCRRDESYFYMDGERHDTGDPPTFYASVRLALPEPHLVTPINNPPREAYKLIPMGAAIQVTGEEQHLSALRRHITAAGEAWAFATLHEIPAPKARTPRSLVEVRIDGERVGQLTPKMSESLLPLLSHCAGQEALAASRAIVKGNELRLEVVLHVARAHEVETAWLRTAPITPALPPAGWYPYGDALRWWDGGQWTEHTHPRP